MDLGRQCEATLAVLPSLSPHDIRALVRAVTSSGVGCTPALRPLWTEMANSVTPGLHTLSDGALVALAADYASVGCRARGLFASIATAAAPRLEAGSYTAREVASLAHAFAHMAHPAPALLRGAGVSAAAQLDDYEPRHLGTLLWSLAAADVPCPELFASDAFAAHVADAALMGGRWSDIERCQLHQWSLWRAERSFDATDSHALPDEVSVACHEAFVRTPPNPSLLQSQVGTALEAAGLQVAHEVVTPQGYSIDLVVEHEGVQVAVEVDGPSHFLGDSEAPTGATLLKRRQLGFFGWAVLPVSYFDFVTTDQYADVFAPLNLREALDALVGPTQRAYRLLGLHPSRSTAVEAKAAYHSRLRRYHPDRNPDDALATARTAEVIDAYKTVQRVQSATGEWQRAQQAAARESDQGADEAFDWKAKLRAEARLHKRARLDDEEMKARAAAERAREAAEREAQKAKSREAQKEHTRREQEKLRAKQRREHEERRVSNERRKVLEEKRRAQQATLERLKAVFDAIPPSGHIDDLQQTSLHVLFYDVDPASSPWFRVEGMARIRIPKGLRHAYTDSEGRSILKMCVQFGDEALIPRRRLSPATWGTLLSALLCIGICFGLASVADRNSDAPQKGFGDVIQQVRQDAASGLLFTAGFVAADAFDGPRAGYVFKSGPKGLGYYRDFHRPEQ